MTLKEAAILVREFGEHVERALKANVSAKKMIDTAALHDSIRANIIADVGNNAYKVEVAFRSYGRIQDLKKLPTDTNTMRRAVWGVGKKGNRGKKWYAKTFYANVKLLRQDLSVAAATEIAEKIVNKLKQ